MRIIIKLLKLVVFALAFFSWNSACATQNYSDWWWNSSQSGMGVHVNHQGNIVAASWFLYDPDGSPSFMLLAGTLTNNQLTGNLSRSTGPQPGPSFDPNAVTRTTVGTATLTFTGSNSATLSYSYNGLSGTLNLSRNTFTSPSISGTWQYAVASTISSCTNSNYNGASTDDGYASIAVSGGRVSMTTYSSDGSSCSYSTSYTQTGSTANGSGTFSCSYGISGSMIFQDLRVSDDFMIANYSKQATSGETCRESGKFGAVKR